MPIQAPQWTEFLSCPVCYNVFNEEDYRPISLACGHTVCRTCLSKFQQRKCPFDQSLISRDIDELPANFALLQLVSVTASPDKQICVSVEYKKYYDRSRKCVEELALLLKPVSSSSTGSIISISTTSTSNSGTPNCVLSRPMQRKLITLVSCQLVEDEGRARALRAARSLGERTVTELILQHQNPQQLSSNLWAAVRGRGCQFLGPGMQEEVLKLILLALEDGSALSRKVLVLFVVQRLEAQYPQASKTAIGHVVQLLYRASCFKVTKREEESSLMQLKEEYRTYETLRREHDSQIVQIAMEAGLRIAPDQWSSLLYGDSTHKSHMQSIIDKLQTPQTFSQSVSELLIALQRTGDPYSLSNLRPELEFLSNIDPSPDVPSPTWENLTGVLRAVKTVIEGLVKFLQCTGVRKPDLTMSFTARYKTSLCRDLVERGSCPRANSCTFAHSEDELETYRQKSRKTVRGHGGYKDEDGPRVDRNDVNGSKPLGKNEGRLGYPQGRGPLPCAPPPLAQPPHVAPPPQLARPPLAAPPPQLLPSPLEAPVDQFLDALPVDVTGNVVQPPVEMLVHPRGIVQPARDIVPPPVTPTANFVPPSPGYVTPVDPAMQPAVENSTSAGMPPNDDTSILQVGNAIPPGNSVIFQQGMVPPPIPQGVVEMQQNTPMPQNMSQMPGMMYPYMPPYAPPATGMMGPRFSMHPMMYGQYPYPAMPPYMAYYQQGFMPPDSPQMPYDNYYTSLNPCAEPWKPAMGRARGLEAWPQGFEKCTVCSQKEEQRRRHLCDKHKHGHDLEWEKGIHTKTDYSNKQQGTNETSQRSVDEVKVVSKDKQHFKNGYGQSEPEDGRYDRNTTKLKKCCENQGYSYQNRTKNGSNEQPSEWSTNDDDEGDENEKGLEESFYYTQHGQSKSESKEQFERNDYQQIKQQKSNQEQLSMEKEQWSSSPSSYSSKDTTAQKKESINSGAVPGSVGSSKTPPVPHVSEPNAKLYRQSLNNLREKRNSLIQQLQEINKEATAQEYQLEELSESLPNLFRFEPVTFKEYSDGIVKDDTVYTSTLKHPEPLDTGPFSLKKADPTNGEIFERLGAISGVPPRSVNDSIMASWTAKTLKYSESGNSSLESSQLEAYNIQKPTETMSGNTVPSSSVKEDSPSKWSNVDKDFPYWKDVVQNLDSAMTTPPSTPWPSTVSSSHSVLKVTSDLLGLSATRYQPTNPAPRSMAYSHKADAVYSKSASVYGQSMSCGTKMSSGSRTIGSRSSAAVVSSSNPNSSSGGLQYHDNYNMDNAENASHATTSKVSSGMVDTVRTSMPQPVSYLTGFDQRSNIASSAVNFWPSASLNSAAAMDVHTTTSFSFASSIYGSYGSTSQICSSVPFSSFQIPGEEEHIPFVDGSPIISKYGPISRSVSKNMEQNTRPVEAVADDDATRTIPVTVVTPLIGPPLPSTQKVPSRFIQTEDGQLKPMDRMSSPLTTYEKSYSLWTTELNLLEQKAKKASTEDEMLSVKLQAVQMQIALKEQELQQAQLMDSTLCSEYMKNRP